MSVQVIPLVLEHYGRWGENAESYLNTLSKRSRDDKGRQNASKFKDYWRKRIAIKLQQCNARVFQKKASDINSILSYTRTLFPYNLIELEICMDS